MQIYMKSICYISVNVIVCKHLKGMSQYELLFPTKINYALSIIMKTYSLQ